MYKYKVQVKKVSGRLNESVLPSKSQAFITLILTTDTDNEWSLEMAKNIVLAHEGDIFR